MAGEPAVPPSDAQEQPQPTSKSEHSYTYWANPSVAPLAEPKKPLTEEEVQLIDRQKSAQGASAWNHAGTFEEKSVGEWGRTWIKANFVGVQRGAVRLHEVTAVDGDANIWFVRGKLRHGFDFSVTASWRADVPAKGALPAYEMTGTVKIPNACLDDIDELHAEVEVTSKKAERAGEEAAAAREAVAMMPLLSAKLKLLYDELKLKQ